MLQGADHRQGYPEEASVPQRHQRRPGPLARGAAVGVGPDAFERAEALIAEDVDPLVVDTSHGHSRMVVETVKRLACLWLARPVRGGQRGDGRGN